MIKKLGRWCLCIPVYTSIFVALILCCSVSFGGVGNVERLASSKTPMLKQSTNSNYAITSVTVIDMQTGVKAVKDILVKGERIVEIGLPGTIAFPQQTRVVNADGQFAIPGLWDAHTHLTIVPGYAHQASKLYVANGVTSVRDMGGQLEDVLALRQYNRQQGVVAPRMWIAGPIIDGVPHINERISVEVDTPREAIDLVDHLVEMGIDFIKPYHMLRPEVFKALVERAQYHHLPIAGHIPSRMSIPEVLEEIGQFDIQHVTGNTIGLIYEGVQDNQPMPDYTAMLDAGKTDEMGYDLLARILNATDVTREDLDAKKITTLIQLLVDKGAWNTPTLLGAIADARILGLAEDPFIKETVQYQCRKLLLQLEAEAAKKKAAIEAIYSKRALLELQVLEFVGQIHKAGVKLLAGTEFVGTPGFNLHMELKALVVVGLSPLEALQTATLNPAKYFNILEDFGSIDVGKYADILLLEKDPLADIDHTRSITSVFLRGQHFDKHSLKNILELTLSECNASQSLR